MKLRKILSVLFILLILFNVSLAQRPESSVGTRMRFTLRNAADIATFGTPPSGALYLYAQDDTTLRYKDADGIVHILAQFTNDSLYIDSLHFNLAWGDSIWANWAQITKFVTPYENAVTVAKSGGDYTTIQSAVTAASGLRDAGEIYTVIVFPDDYDEAITLADSVDIVAIDPEATKILRQVTDNNVASRNYLNITIESASGQGLYIRHASSIITFVGNISSSANKGLSVDNGIVTFTGNVISTNSAAAYCEGGSLTINGNISSTVNKALDTGGGGTVTVNNGTISSTYNSASGNGIDTGPSTTLILHGVKIVCTHANAKSIWAEEACNVSCTSVWTNRDDSDYITQLIPSGFTFDALMDGLTAKTISDGTATLTGGDLTGLDSLQVSKVSAYTLYGQLSGNQQNITNVNEFTADSISVARLDADSSYLGILGENLDANQKNITDLNKLNTDSTSAFVVDGNLDMNQNNILDVNEITVDSAAIARLDADSSFLGILGENVDGNQKNVTDLNKMSTDTLSAFVAEGNIDLNQKNIVDINELTADSIAVARLDADSSFLGILGENLDGNQKNLTDMNKVVSDTLNDGTATLTAGALSGITTIGMNNQLTNTLADGTTPMVITSTTKVGNLNVDRVDGVHLASLTDTRLMRYESTGTQIENATVTETSGALGGITTIGMSGQLTNSLAIGTSPFAVTSTTVNTNLNADLLDAKSEAAFATLAEAETVSGKYTFSDTLIASKAVKGADGVLLTNETATKATLPSNTSWMYPYDDGSSVHLMATKDDNGTETVVKIAEQSSITNLSSKGAVYSFDGVNDYIQVTDNSNIDFGTGDYSILLSHIPRSNTVAQNIVTKGRIVTTGGATTAGYVLGIQSTSYRWEIGDGSHYVYHLSSMPVGVNKSENVALIVDRDVGATFIINDVIVYSGNGTGDGVTAVNGDISNATNLGIGGLPAVPTTNPYLGSIHSLYLFNCAITDVDERAQIALGNIPAKYQWGSQTELMPNQVDRDFSGASAWADVDLVSGSGAYDETGDLTITAGAAGSGDYCTCPVLSMPTTIGKVYRLKYDYTVAVAGAWTIKDFTGVQTIGTISATATQGILEWTATTTGGLRIVAAANDVSGTFDNFTLTKLGAVAAYLPQNMTASTAYDASSNKLNGTVSGATLLNAKVADAFVNPEIATSDDDVIATVKHSGYDSAGNLDDFVKFETIMQDVTATTEDGGYKISAIVAGTMTNTLEYDGNTGILDIAGAFTAASVVSDAQVTATTTVSGATYGSNGSVTDAELLYVNTLSSNAQDQLDERCLESVFGTAIGTGLTLDATTLKTHAALQSIAGLTEADVSILEATADNTYSVVTSGGNNYMLASDGTNANLVFVQPSTVLSNIGAQPVDANLTSIAGLSHAVGDILYANAATTYLSLADVAAGQPLLSGGVTTAPAYAGYTFSGTAAQTYTFPTSSASLAPLAAPTFVTSFTSPGIDDNADAIAITIDVTTEKVNMSGACDIDGALTANVFNYYADTSSVNDSWGFTAAAIGAYTTGLSIFVNIAVVNTDGATLQINALGAKAVLKRHDQALITGDVEVGQIIHLIYDGTQFQMLSQLAQ